MSRLGSPWSELARARNQEFQSRLPEIKIWRERENSAGRPSGLEDFFRAHDLCFACRTTGTNLSQVGWDGEIPLFAQCEVCSGTGKVNASSPKVNPSSSQPAS